MKPHTVLEGKQFDEVHTMFIYHISNCGLLIKLAGKNILIDGIFCDENPFNPMRADIEKDIFEGNELFKNLDCILFTHCHKDHFDINKVLEFQRQHPKINIVVPKDSAMNREAFMMVAKKGCFTIGDMKVTYYKTPHMHTGKNDNVDHASFIFEGDGKRIFVSGDMELTEGMTEILREYGRYDVGVLNPIIIANKKWRERLLRIDMDKKYIYHIPLEENDTYAYRTVALNAVKKQGEHLGYCVPLLGEMEPVE